MKVGPHTVHTQRMCVCVSDEVWKKWFQAFASTSICVSVYACHKVWLCVATRFVSMKYFECHNSLLCVFNELTMADRCSVAEAH